MKRMHVGLKVRDLEESIVFYTRLFGEVPTLQKKGYAKWMLDDPRVNFSIDTHGTDPIGSAHYGIQVESEEELCEMRQRIDDAELPRKDQNEFICGYQLQDKSWVNDPHGVQWETFLTHRIVDGVEYGGQVVPCPN